MVPKRAGLLLEILSQLKRMELQFTLDDVIPYYLKSDILLLPS